jgi:TRAP-type transport system periplasmic protein
MCCPLPARNVVAIVAEGSETMGAMKNRSRFAALILAATATLATAACGGTGEDKAGGRGATVLLRLANTGDTIDQTPAVEYFVKRVAALSEGSVRVEVVDRWAKFAPDAEQQVVRDVATHKVDLGWVGTRVFDTMGHKSFQALTAPMLVDSYALEKAVIESGITEQMMAGLDDLGVVGLDVLADGLRMPIGVTAPILGPSDWRGIAFGTLRSDGQLEAIRALGATPAQVFGSEREEALGKGTIQGFELSMWLFATNPTWPSLAPYVASNVHLWPQMDVLLANPARIGALTAKQRGWLKAAARDAAVRSAGFADKDAWALGVACRTGARFAEASDADLAALEAAFAPVYANLQHHPQTKAFIDRIQALKQSTPPGPALSIPSACVGKAPQQAPVGTDSAPASLNGIYRYVLTRAEKVRDPEATDFPTVETWTLRDGRAENPKGLSGTYSVNGNRITFQFTGFGYTNTFTLRVDDAGNLHLTPVPPMDPGDAFLLSYKSWTKIG